MTTARLPWTWEAAARKARALAFGIVVGIGLVTTYVAVDASRHARNAAAIGAKPLFSVEAQVALALYYSTQAAVAIALISAPAWILLARYNQTGWGVAAALGFVVTLAYWIASNLPISDVPDTVGVGLLLAACGAAAGLATRWAGLRK